MRVLRGSWDLDFALTEDQLMLRNLVERFVTERYDTATRPLHETPAAGFTPGNWSLLAETGLLALPFEEAVGGLGGGPVEIITVMEVLGRGLVAEPYLSSILMGGLLLQAAGTEAQKAGWLEAVVAGEGHVALALAEPGSRFDVDFAATEARGASGAVTLSGFKTFVLAGEATQVYVVTARDSGGQIGLYLVRSDAPGLVVQSYRLLDGATAQELTLTGVPAEPLEGGITALNAVVQTARLAACAEMLGVMSMLFDVTLEYLKTRKQFGVPIGSFQALQHRMADLYASLEQSRSIILKAALAPEDERAAATAAAKAYVSTAAVKLAEEAVQLHGGMGVSEELIVGHGLKRVLVLASLFGDANVELTRYLTLTGRA